LAINTAAAVVVVLILPAVADARAMLLSTEPTAGSAQATTPHRVRLVFNEQIEASLGQVTLVTADGRRMSLRAGADPQDVRALVAPVDSLGHGSYRVVWRVISADGHPVGGSFVFAVGTAAPDTAVADLSAGAQGPSIDQTTPVGPVVAGAPLLASVVRGAAAWCLMALGGLLLFLVWTGPQPTGRAARLAMWLAIAAPVLLAAHLVIWLADTAPPHGFDAAWAQAALATGTGRAEIVRCGFALLALWSVWLARRSALALVFTVGALIASAGVGHAAAIHPVWALPLKVVHLFAAAAWLGGLLWLIVGEPSEPDAQLAAAHRVSTVALVAVGALFLTGIVETLIFAPSVTALLRSSYGAIVIAKLVGLGVLIAFGAYHRRVSLPGLRRGIGAQDFRRTVAWEVSVMTMVVLLGGWLAYVAPPVVAQTQSLAIHSPTIGVQQ
jgi:copper transport protein